MSETKVEWPDAIRWTDRLYQGVPVAPVWVGFTITAGLLAVFLAIAWAFGGLATVQAGELRFWEYREARFSILVALLVGYLPTARRYVALVAAKNLEDLLPLMNSPSRGYDGVRRIFGLLDARAARAAGLLALLVVPVTALAIDRDPGLYFGSGYWGPENCFSWLVGGLAAWNFGLFVYETLAYARRFSSLAGELGRIDLLDLRALAPFARQGLRSALLWMVLISLISLNAIDFTWFSATAALALAGSTAALLLPVRGIHLRLRQAKQAELERVNAAIRGNSQPLTESLIGGRPGSLGLADLLAYRQFVESVHEWPFDSPTILRFALYLAIPVGSWLGGAFVERLLAAALD